MKLEDAAKAMQELGHDIQWRTWHGGHPSDKAEESHKGTCYKCGTQFENHDNTWNTDYIWWTLVGQDATAGSVPAEVPSCTEAIIQDIIK